MRATHNNRRHTFVSCGASLCLLLAATAHAQTQTTLLDQVHTVASADTGIPVENDFDVSVPGSYQIQLTDLGKSVGSAVASVSLALTSGDALVGTPLTGEGTLSFTATAAGSYRVHIVGAPKLNSGGDPLPGSGLISVQISATSAGAPVGAPIFSITENLALPTQSLPGSVGYLQDSLTVTAQTAGAYQLAIADLGWPATLASPPTLLFVPPGGGSPVILPDPNTHALQTTVLLNAGSTYQIYALGQVALNATAGLYSVSLMPTTGAALYSKAVPVGDATPLGTVLLSSAAASFAAADLAFPVQLADLKTAAVLGSQLVPLVGTGSTPFAATAGAYYQIFGVSEPAQSGAGSYAVQITQSGQTTFNVARGVAAPGSGLTAYSFDTSIGTAGTYTANLTDFKFPKALVSASLLAVQGVAAVGSPLTAPGGVSITASVGPLTLVGFAQPDTAGSLLDADIVSGQTLLFDATQAIGVPFTPIKLSIPNGGNYALTAADLKFPAGFTDFAVLITQGGTSVGSIVAGGSSKFTATPGNYFVNFLAHPDPAAKAGTYALNVVSVPAPPVVTLGADATSVASGSAVRLNWTSTNATTCVGSGGGWTTTYTGTQVATGTDESPALTGNTTFTLTCTGAGGPTSQSVSVSVTGADTTKSSGGGGRLDLWILGALFAAMGLRARAAGNRRAG